MRARHSAINASCFRHSAGAVGNAFFQRRTFRRGGDTFRQDVEHAIFGIPVDFQAVTRSPNDNGTR